LERRVFRKLEQLGIDKESKLGKSLIKLDDLYIEKNKLYKEKRNNQNKIDQIKEDIEMLEIMIMYMFNKKVRDE